MHLFESSTVQGQLQETLDRANHTGTQPIDTVEGLGEALSSVRIFDSAAEGRAAVQDGQYYYVVSDDPDVSRELWQRISETESEFITEDPSAAFFDGIDTRLDSQNTRITRINDQVSALNIYRYIGDGPLYPWAVDQDGKMLGWFNEDGTGFANIYTLIDPENPLIENLYTTQEAQEKTISRVNEHVAGLTLSQYVGDGPMYPWAVDAEGNILGWFNEDGTGFASIYTLIDPQNPLLRESQHLGYGRDLQLVQYQGDGEIVPIVVDSANQVLLGFDASSGQMVGSFSAPSGASTQTRVVLSDRLVTVYMKGSTPSSNIWLEHTIVHDTDLTLDANAAYDVWHSSEIWECSRLGDTFTRIRRLVLSGETECAIYERLPPDETIAPDAIGGSIHGMEYLDWAYLLVDGVPRELDDYGTFDCETLSMAFQSRLYRYDTGSRDPVTDELDPGLLVAMKNTKWQFKRDSRILYNTLTFEEDMLTNRTLLAMFSVERDNANSPFENLTNTAYRSPTWAQEDVSSSDGFPTLQTNTDEIMLSGDTGISASVAILKSSPEFPDASAYVTDRAQYNKIYFNVTGDRVLLNAGDVLSITAEYKINSTN